MLNKHAHKTRAISNLNFTEGPEQPSAIGIRIIEGRLSVNVSRIGPMYAYVHLIFGQDSWKSDPSSVGGMHPKWNLFHHFSTSSQTLEVIVMNKVFLFGDTEVGRCTIHLSDVVQGHLTQWWDIMSAKPEITGAVLISFEMHATETISTHASNSSYDFRGHHQIESSPIVHRVKNPISSQINAMTPDYKSLRAVTEPDEANKLEQLREDLIEENERLKTQETKVKMFFEKLKGESIALKGEKIEVRRCTETLRVKEENMLALRAQIQNEKEFIEEGRIEIEKMKESLNMSYSELKKEKLKVRVHRKLLEKGIRKIGRNSNQLDIEKNRFEINTGEQFSYFEQVVD